MIWTNEVKSQFTVFVLSGDIDQCATAKTAISREGFETFLFPDAETMMTRVKEMAPHLIVFSKTGISTKVSDFVQKIVDINSEIQFLPLAKTSEVSEFLNYRQFNFVGVCIEGDAFTQRLSWTVDQCLQKNYLSYQNEQIFTEFQKSNDELKHIQQKIESSNVKAENSSGLILKEELKKYANADSKEEVLKIYFRELGQKFLTKNKKISSIYFKYLPTVQSFVVIQSLGVPIEKIEGIGIKLKDAEFKDPLSFFRKENRPQELMALMLEGLKVKNFLFRSLFVTDNLDGFFVYWGENEPIADLEIENDFEFFKMIYERGFFIKKLNSMEISDNITELYNRFFFLKNITDEVSRSRRLQKAVSLVKIRIDLFQELQESFGPGGRDQILKAVSSLIRKTSRVNDICCRTGDNEISMILPHSPQKGAIIRAERVRRMIEAQSFHNLGQRVTISSGVSEYPSLCSSSEELEKTCLEALDYVASQEGNKVCLYRPHDNFVPDFNISTI